jgi:DEAD/DEAH box helicase domain-containing protein
MQSIADTIQAIARQRGRGDATPLIALRQMDGAPGERVSHLPVDQTLSQAWLAMTAEPFRPHHAQALAALRRGDPVALRGSNAEAATSAQLLTYALLADERAATALLVAPDDGEALNLLAQFEQINENLPATLRLAVSLATPGQRPDPYARVVLATPEALHGRLLRHHERAWRQFWPALRLIVLPDIQRYTGVAGAHLADLLLRSLRVTSAHGGATPAMLATLTEVAEPEPTLTSLLGQQWRVVNSDDGPRGTPLLAIWQSGATRLRETADLAIALQRQGYHVHIACDVLEQVAITPVIGDAAGISVGPGLGAAHVLVCAGYPGSTSMLRRMLRSGVQAVLVVLGDLPHEQALARHVEALISGPPAVWPPPPANAYATAQHVLCAASELPLTSHEIEGWGAREVVARLAAHNQLVDLPDSEEAWKPAKGAGDPYTDFSLLAASGAPISARTEQGVALGAFDPTGFERWTFPGAALPPGAGGMRVVGRDEERGSVTLRMETSGRRTYPLRRCTVEVRETRETRSIAGGKQLHWGRVVASEEVYGYREATAGQAPADMALKTPLTTRWVAPACWFDVGMDIQAHGQLVGWSLAAALPLRVLCVFTDMVPCYDQTTRRVYLVDAQPGGSGVALWLYGHAEELLPLAYDVALACRSDPLLEPLSRADQDWLLALLGRTIDGRPQTTDRRPSNREPRTENREPRTENREPRTQNRELRTENADHGPQTRDHRPKTTDSRTQNAEPSQMSRPPIAPAAPAAAPQRRPEPSANQPPASAAPQQRPEPVPAPPPAAARSQTPRQAEVPAEAPPRQPPKSVPPANAQLWDAPEPPFPAVHDERRAPEPLNLPEHRPPRELPPQRSQNTQRRSEPEQRPPEPPARVEQRGNERDTRATPPARQQTPAPEPDEGLPDASALIERLRRQREQREGGRGRVARQPAPRERSSAAVEQRFAAGDRIFCLPYGDGVVQESRVDDGRELLLVEFPDHGALEVDPAVSLVRKLEDDSPAVDDDLL